MVKQLRQVPIFRNENLFIPTAENIKRGLDSNQKAFSEFVDKKREDSAVQFGQLKNAFDSIGELQAQAEFTHQPFIDNKIKEAQQWLEGFDGDRTSAEFQSDLNQRLRQIQTMNERSQGLVGLLPEIKKKSEQDQYNTAAVQSSVNELINNPETLQNFSSIGEEVDKIFFENFDENIAIKEAMAELYGTREVSRSVTDAEGGVFKEDFTVRDIFTEFSEDGQIVADRDKIDTTFWKEKHPEVVRKIQQQLNDPQAFPQIAKSLSSLTPDEMLKEAIATRMERMGQLRLSVDRKSPSALDQSRRAATEALTRKRNADAQGKKPVDFQANLNQWVDGILNEDAAKTRQAAPTGLEMRFSKKSEVSDKLTSKLAEMHRDKEGFLKVQKAIQSLQKFNDNDIVSVKVGDLDFEPSKTGLKDAFIVASRKAFTNRDDVANLNTADLSLDERVSPERLKLLNEKFKGSQVVWDVVKEALSTISSKNVANQEETQEEVEEVDETEIDEEEQDRLIDQYLDNK